MAAPENDPNPTDPRKPEQDPTFAEFKKMESNLNWNQTCPSCGYCPTCGRHYNQFNISPYYPRYQPPYFGPTWMGGAHTTI